MRPTYRVRSRDIAILGYLGGKEGHLKNEKLVHEFINNTKQLRSQSQAAQERFGVIP